MASRKEKFTFVKLLLLMVAVIWLPRLLKPLAGVSDSSKPVIEQSQTPHIEPVNTPADPPIEVQPISTVVPETEPVARVEHVEEGGFFELDQVRPAPTGMELLATLVSPTGKTAIINGRAYAEGDLITIGDLPFRLRSILPGRAVLERDGGMFELKEKRNFSEFFPRLHKSENLNK